MQDLLDEPLTRLAYRGCDVWTLRGHFDPERPAVGEQFLEGAAAYDTHSFDAEAMRVRLGASVRRALPSTCPPGTILDLGCGSGQTVVAAAGLFPEAEIVALDMSPQMIALLQRRAGTLGFADRLTAVVADASKLAFRSPRFDLVVGSSVLHHLVDPFGALHSIMSGVKAQGAAVFYEPFQAGNVLVRQCLGEVVRRSSGSDGLEVRLAAFARQCVLGLDLMFDASRTHPILPRLDDKWSFTRLQFTRFAEAEGLPAPEIRSINIAEGTLEEKVCALLRHALSAHEEVPGWIRELTQAADRFVSDDLREELLIEGEIVLRV